MASYVTPVSSVCYWIALERRMTITTCGDVTPLNVALKYAFTHIECDKVTGLATAASQSQRNNRHFGSILRVSANYSRSPKNRGQFFGERLYAANLHKQRSGSRRSDCFGRRYCTAASLTNSSRPTRRHFARDASLALRLEWPFRTSDEAPLVLYGPSFASNGETQRLP